MSDIAKIDYLMEFIIVIREQKSFLLAISLSLQSLKK